MSMSYEALKTGDYILAVVFVAFNRSSLADDRREGFDYEPWTMNYQLKIQSKIEFSRARRGVSGAL